MRKLYLPLVLSIATTAVLSAQPPKKRIAVLDFDFATVQSNVAAIFGTNQDIGKGIADMLVDRFVNDGTYSVIERKALNKILAEQNFSNSDRADPNSAAKLGRVLGVDAIVIGSITQFGRDDKNTSVAGGGIGGITRRYGIGGIGHKEAKAVVGITARIVNVETGEILASAQGFGKSERSGTSLLGSGGSGWNNGGGAIDMSSKNFGTTIIGEATNNAVSDVARQLEGSAANLPTHTIRLDGLVADASGDSLVLNIGSKAGVHVGDRLEVSRPVRTIKDPSTGKVIRQIENKLGEVVITEVDELSSVGKFTGSGPVKVGDTVKN
jgi:curli biogenesis system outer membrane secretion channel CsgG